ncbi:MAG: DUF2442 domain-containing protein [Candidatus Ancillula sp.]|jgi:hypothetical protein|nr:DUF2442 domain-containing protein [Candidatus Ancillula sp.]
MNDVVKSENKIISVVSVEPKNNYILQLSFSDGKKGIFDFSKELNFKPFLLLKNKNLFNTAHVDFGTVIWGKDEVDISAQYLYDHIIQS